MPSDRAGSSRPGGKIRRYHGRGALRRKAFSDLHGVLLPEDFKVTLPYRAERQFSLDPRRLRSTGRVKSLARELADAGPRLTNSLGNSVDY